MEEYTAIEINQNGQILYLFSMSAKTIYDKFSVSRRVEDKEKGYQRSFSATRLKQIANYLNKESGFLPNSILVNIDNEKYNFENGKLYLNLEEESIGFIIDGQHRVGGANLAENDIVLPVVATVKLSEVEQAKLFIKINKNQRGVPVSLYLDLLNITEGEIVDFDGQDVTAERRAIEIAKRLNEDEESPMYDKVRMTGEPGKGISLSEFVNLLKPFVEPKKGNFMTLGFEDQYKLFNIYLKAFKAVFLEQWDDSSTLLLKTVGFGAMIKSCYDIFTLVIQKHKKFTTETCIDVISKISDLKFDSETMPGGGIKAQDSAKTLLVSHLRKALREDDDFTFEIGE
ncbi:DGQHR domain-containing protein [Myroides sp. LJL116]